MLRVTLFGAGGPASLEAFESLVQVADVAAVVVPRPAGGVRRLIVPSPSAAFRKAAARRGIPVLTWGAPLPESDLGLAAAFPQLIPAAMRKAWRLGAINLHPSILPRHRGPDPLFWTYFDNDAEAGTTLHWMTDGVDDGDVIAQKRMSLRRGTPGRDLYLQLSRLGAELIREEVPRIESGTASRTPQDDREMSREPSPSRETWAIDYAVWSAERMWHFLRGMEHRAGFTIRDRNGRRHVIGAVRDPRCFEHREAPGTIRRREVFTIDGSVSWEPAPWPRRLRAFLRRNPSR